MSSIFIKVSNLLPKCEITVKGNFDVTKFYEDSDLDEKLATSFHSNFFLYKVILKF